MLNEMKNSRSSDLLPMFYDCKYFSQKKYYIVYAIYTLLSQQSYGYIFGIYIMKKVKKKNISLDSVHSTTYPWSWPSVVQPFRGFINERHDLIT